MPIRPPALDDRSFDDLVAEVLTRIPAHTPEWTNPRLGDPGRTLVELFAWLTDTLLYRANLIPERQRLAFLRLLGIQMRSAIPASTVVGLAIDDEDVTDAVVIQPLATVKGPVNFETRSEVTVLPIGAEACYKRPLTEDEAREMADVVQGLREIYQLDQAARPYIATPVFAGDVPEKDGFDLVTRTVDKCLWLALLAPKPEQVEAVKETLGANEFGGQQLLSVGVVPSIEVPALFEDIGPRAHIPHVWEISSVNEKGETEYHTLDLIADSTAGLTRRGVQRLALPSAEFIGAPSNDVREAIEAGVGDRPPRLDDSKKAERLVAWLRLRPAVSLESLSLSWIGINAVEIDQRQTIAGRIVGQSDGTADQEMQLPGQSVEVESLQIQVEETGRGYQPWQRIEDLALAGRDAPVFSLDSEAGTIRFGDGIRGRVPELGRRVRVALMRVGGGEAGNLPPGSLTKISARDLAGRPVTNLKVSQPLPADGGQDAETLEEAERRIPALLRHRERAVTEEDYKRLAADTPAIRMGRVEVLPRFKPHQRRNNVPGVVSVMVLPFKEAASAPNPRPDRPFLESVHAYLDTRRPLGTELYVIGCQYIPLGISASVSIGDGFDREGILREIRESLRRYLWPLAPGGPQSEGWPLGRAVRDRELEVVVARVAGVDSVIGVNLFERQDDDWRMLPRAGANAPVDLKLQRWQLPELLTVVVIAADAAGVGAGAGLGAPTDLSGAPNPFAAESGIAIPVVPEVCR
jgi:predicted phage baseplate assembly protein